MKESEKFDLVKQSIPSSTRGISNKRQRRYIQDKPFETGDVWVLVRKLKDNGKYQLLLGGKIQPPLVVADDLAANFLNAELDLKTSDDWIVSYKSFPTTGDITIGSISGSRRTIENQWSITSPVSTYLLHYGYGFFASSQPFGMTIGRFTNVDSTPFPSPTSRPPGLGVLTVSGYHGQIQGNSTVQVEYYENRFINGPASASRAAYDYRTGIVQLPNFPFQLTGTNTYLVDYQQNASYIGGVQGPGNLGPEGNVGCNLSDPEITGTALIPKLVISNITNTEANYSAINYSFSAYQGKLNISQGDNSYTESFTNSAVYETYFVNGPLKRIDYRGRCERYTSPSAQLWSIGTSSFELWPFDPQRFSLDYRGLNASLTNNIGIAPGVSKIFNYTAGRINMNADVLGNGEYFAPNKVINGGYVYKKELFSGSAQFTFQNSGPFPTWERRDSRKFLLNFNGQELELFQELPQDVIFAQEDDRPYPVGYKAIQKDSDNFNFDGRKAFDIFKKSIEMEVSVFTGNLENGKLVYTSQEENKKHTALPLKVNSRADFSDVSVMDYRYLPKA